MSEQETVISQDLLDQIAKLAGFEDILQKHMRPAMTQATSLLAGAIEPNIPTLTGFAAKTFGVHITGSGLSLTGYVGWKGRPTAWWMNVVEYGAKPHDLTSKGHAGHVIIDGQFKTIHQHPGFPGRFLLSGAYQENKEAVEYFFGVAADQTLEELAVHD